MGARSKLNGAVLNGSLLVGYLMILTKRVPFGVSPPVLGVSPLGKNRGLTRLLKNVG